VKPGCLPGLLREIGRYFCGSARSRWRQRARLAELEARLLADVGLRREGRASIGSIPAADTPARPAAASTGTRPAGAGLIRGEECL